MEVWIYVIVGFCSFESLVSCAEYTEEDEVNDDFFVSVPPENSKDVFYLETTENPVYERLKSDSQESFARDFLKPEALISDPLFEDSSPNKSNAKRDVFQGAWTHANKMQMLQLHNLYRSNVTPPAGNMAYMEWDEELEELAQEWANRCIFEHGMPDNDYPETIGQNLYIGTDPTGYLGLYMWYEEYHDYDLRKEHCTPNKQCGHYVQMAWSESEKLGCAMNKCNMRYYVVCHYSPQALRGVQMYRVATPCSQCSDKGGVLCLKNLCITPEQCKNNAFDCQDAKCNMKCHNCGLLDKERCTCECADGWDSPDCSYKCMDKHKRCGMNPGWPTKASCALNNYAVANTYCRKMCGMCNPVVEKSDTCCEGKECDNGYVLDLRSKSCKCSLLCPGPLCDGQKTSDNKIKTSGTDSLFQDEQETADDEDVSKTQAVLGSGADSLRTSHSFVILMAVITQYRKFLWKCF